MVGTVAAIWLVCAVLISIVLATMEKDASLRVDPLKAALAVLFAPVYVLAIIGIVLTEIVKVPKIGR
jgi:hypothetical protein